MTPEEFNRIRDLVDDEVQAIVNGQLIIAELHEELERRQFRPFEDDIIMEEHFGARPTEPRVRRIGNVELITRVLHRRGVGQSDIKGADLLYEIEGRKYILIQYKLVNNSGKVVVDHAQLDTIIANCTLERDPFFRMYGKPPRITSWCGSWYAVVGASEVRYMKACEAKSVFGASSSASENAFRSGLTRPTFDELFASCRIGSYVTLSASEVAAYTSWSLNSDRLLFNVLQRGQF